MCFTLNPFVRKLCLFVRLGVEFAIGALAAVGAGFFTNPVDVVKVRLQLQGELEARGAYKKIYKNTLHAAYLIAKHEGAFALQAGLVPALAFQVVLNGIRLGAYKSAQRYELILDKQGNTDVLRTVLVSGTAGCVGAVLGSPFYLVITVITVIFSSTSTIPSSGLSPPSTRYSKAKLSRDLTRSSTANVLLVVLGLRREIQNHIGRLNRRKTALRFRRAGEPNDERRVSLFLSD